MYQGKYYKLIGRQFFKKADIIRGIREWPYTLRSYDPYYREGIFEDPTGLTWRFAVNTMSLISNTEPAVVVSTTTVEDLLLSLR